MLEMFCHIVHFSCIFTIILHMSGFSVYFPTYVQHLPYLRSKFAKLIHISIFLKGSWPLCPHPMPPYTPAHPPRLLRLCLGSHTSYNAG